MTSEARTLGSWLRHVTNPLADYERLTFIEPNLAFDVLRRTDDAVTIRVVFELEARPSHLATGAVGEDECWVDLDIGSQVLQDASDAWLVELESFPERRP